VGALNAPQGVLWCRRRKRASRCGRNLLLPSHTMTRACGPWSSAPQLLRSAVGKLGLSAPWWATKRDALSSQGCWDSLRGGLRRRGARAIAIPKPWRGLLDIIGFNQSRASSAHRMRETDDDN